MRNKMSNEEIVSLIRRALYEDIRTGDITTDAILAPETKAEADFLVKENGIIAGQEIVREVFNQVDPGLKFNPLKNDGDNIKVADIAAVVIGSAASILKGERTALNFLQRMSGIATLAGRYRQEIKHTNAKILDTRKTVPGLRLLDKMAVQIGGCKNHRMGLYDMFLIKDNHIEVAGSITKAVESCRSYMKKNNIKSEIEVETKNLREVSEAAACGADIIMLDNFPIEEMNKAVKLINRKCRLEASGGVNLQTVKAIAETGVDYISVGALTHSVKALDISLEIRL